MPLLGLGAGLVELVAPELGLSSCLPRDPEGSPDLGPVRALAACCGDGEDSCSVDGLLGVSEPFQGLQGPLWASPGGFQVLDGSACLVAGVAAVLGAHDNGYCTGPTTRMVHNVDNLDCRSICDTAYPDIARPRVGPADPALSGFPYPGPKQRNDPATVAAARGHGRIRSN